jgi:hypothetical protein
MVRLLLNPAEPEGARYLEKVVAEHSANSCMLIVHEALGRSCGWLTACTAKVYRERLDERNFLQGLGLGKDRRDARGVYIAEMAIDLFAEVQRLKAIMDEKDCVNIFISEDAALSGVDGEIGHDDGSYGLPPQRIASSGSSCRDAPRGSEPRELSLSRGHLKVRMLLTRYTSSPPRLARCPGRLDDPVGMPRLDHAPHALLPIHLRRAD